ncbi:MAG: lauroyl acyltransferase [Desulfosarcinaceae bacterium]
MKNRFFRILAWLSRFFGNWLFALVARGIAAGFFLFARRRRRASVDFYATLFPGKGPLHAHICTWRQFFGFTDLFMDHYLAVEGGQRSLEYTAEGFEHLQRVHTDGTGCVLLMSHMGNWQVAAHLLNRDMPDTPLMLYMGQAQKQQLEKQQKAVLTADGVHIVTVDETGGSPFDIVEGVRFLRDGGIVSLTGDRIWRSGQRAVTATFLGRSIQLPEAPYILSLMGNGRPPSRPPPSSMPMPWRTPCAGIPCSGTTLTRFSLSLQKTRLHEWPKFFLRMRRSCGPSLIKCSRGPSDAPQACRFNG